MRVNQFAWKWMQEESVLVLSGDDSLSWLQGQVTNDVRLLGPGHPLSFCFCRSTGQIEAVATAILKEQNEVYLITPNQCINAIQQRVDHFVVTEDVFLSKTDLNLASVQSWDTSDHFEIVAKDLASQGHFVFPCQQSPGGGFGVLLNPDQIAEFQSAIGIESSAQECEAMRILSGRPKFGSDISAASFPAELGKGFEASHVSYSKGCYLGQEVIMRIYSQGHVNWTWQLMASSVPVQEGLDVYAHEKKVGLVTSVVADSPVGPMAGVRIRTSVEGDSEIYCLDEGHQISLKPQSFLETGLQLSGTP